jgi:hypothetical protein
MLGAVVLPTAVVAGGEAGRGITGGTGVTSEVEGGIRIAAAGAGTVGGATRGLLERSDRISAVGTVPGTAAASKGGSAMTAATGRSFIAPLTERGSGNCWDKLPTIQNAAVCNPRITGMRVASSKPAFQKKAFIVSTR